MSSSQPLVSVMVTTYNHEKYIREAVASALAQTVHDIEVVVVDDGSTDRTGEIIRSIADPRLRYIRQPNQGPSAAANTAMAACRGKHLAMLSGDDVLHPQRLERQLRAYQRGPTRVVFSGTEFIDDDGQPLPLTVCPEIFEDGNVNRAQFLERFFFAPSCTSPRWSGITAFSELHVFREAGPADPALAQINDYLRWLQLVKKYDFEILPDRLYKLRIRTAYENLSGPAPGKQIRLINEMMLVTRSFFRDISTSLFREAFQRHLINPNFVSEIERACEEAFLLFHSPRPLIPLLGVERLYELLHSPEGADVLRTRYQFDVVRFGEDLSRLDCARLFVGCNSVVVVDQGDGWRQENMVRRVVNPYFPQFRHVFDLGRFPKHRMIVWIPFEEHRLGRVQVERFRYRDAEGLHDLDPRGLSRHACSLVGDWHVFERPEAYLSFAPSAPVNELEITGQLELMSPADTYARLSATLAEKEALIERLTRQVEGRKRQTRARPDGSLWSSLGRRARQGVRRLGRIFSN